MRGLLLCWMICCGGGLWAQTRPYGVWELRDGIDIRGYANPFDYKEVAFRCLIEGPGGVRDTIDGFYMQDYRLDTVSGRLAVSGRPGFRVRYTPGLVGRYDYRTWYEDKDGTHQGPRGHFFCSGLPDGHGFVRKDGRSWLFFDDSTQFVPVGENMGWANRNAYLDYHRWIGRLTENGGNFIRVWMPAWGLGIEWRKGSGPYEGLMHYQQEHAWYLDWLLEFCRGKGVHLMLTLNHHGQVSSKTDPNWNESPYNAINGGPCKNTWDFFTDSISRGLIRNRLRYIVARYGYSSALAFWELFNEVDWTDDFVHHRADVAAWHHEMALWLRRLDPNKHLVTTSYGNARYDSLSWKDTAIDITQTHYYFTTPAIEQVLDSAGRAYGARFGKPTLNAEFGLGGDAGPLREADPSGIHIHNVLWGSVLGGGGMGTAMSWWWDNYIDPNGLYIHFRGVSRFLRGLDLLRRNYAALGGVRCSAGLSAHVLRSKDGLALAGWVLNKSYNWESVRRRAASVVEGGSLIVEGMVDGGYAVEWFDCKEGMSVSRSVVRVKDGVVLVSCPSPLVWDMAFTLTRQD